MQTSIHQPHDKLFKNSMADMRVARNFFEAHLPTEILCQVDLATLKLEKNTFIDSTYKAGEADLIYSVQQGDNTAYLHLHCEHQSTVINLAAFRMLAYKIKLMEEYKKQHPNDPYPIIYSMIIYTGEKPWDAPRDVLDLMSGPRELAQQVLFQPYQLIEVQRIPDHELQKHLWSGLVEFALKYRKTQDIIKFLKTLLPWLDKVSYEGADFAKFVLKYVIDGIEVGDEELFIREVNEHLNSELRGEAMTLAEIWMERGIHTGEAAMLIRQLKFRFREIPADYQKHIDQADAETLLKWGERVLAANTIEEIFA